MASPGVFIHSGTLGGRLSAFGVAARDSLERPLAKATPPIKAPLPRRKCRRDVTTGSSSRSVDSVIVHPPFEAARMEHLNEVVGNPQNISCAAFSAAWLQSIRFNSEIERLLQRLRN